MKGKQKQIIRISHMHTYTALKSTSESQAHQNYLFTYGPEARTGHSISGPCLSVSPSHFEGISLVQVLFFSTTYSFHLACTCALSINNHAQSEYKHSLTFRVRCYVVIAMKPMHRLQICRIVHSQTALPIIPPSYIQVHAIMSECSEGQTDTQTAVTNIHFASTMPYTKCNNNKYNS